MGFQDDLAAETRAGRTCKIAVVRESMSKKDQEALDKAMTDRDKVPTEAIIRALNKDPDTPIIGHKAVGKHREQRCSCFWDVPS